MIQQVTALGTYGVPIPVTFYGATFMNVLNFSLQLAGAIDLNFTPTRPVQQCQVSDGGIDIVLEVVDGLGNPVNLRLASDLKIITVRPSGLSVTTSADLYTNGFNGQMSITTGVGTPFGAGLNEPGKWQVQGRFIFGGELQFTTIGSFSVLRNLGA